jgi:hypothetical protein
MLQKKIQKNINNIQVKSELQSQSSDLERRWREMNGMVEEVTAMIHSLGEENFSGAAALRLERDMRTGE